MTHRLPAPPSEPAQVLVGCGILHKEVSYLIEKNGWHLATRFLDSALHNYLGKLSEQLNAALADERRQGHDPVIFYGCCHPNMEQIARSWQVRRTSGQNCIVMLLGYQRFMQELEAGAYFLLEDWANTWQPMITQCFGANPAVVREIFHGSHKVMIALRTPCSDDFTAAAERAAAFVELPLVWLDTDLSHLEAMLAEAIGQPQDGSA